MFGVTFGLSRGGGSGVSNGLSACGVGANGIGSEEIGSDTFGADPSFMHNNETDELKRSSALNLRHFDHHIDVVECYHSMEFDSNLHKYMHPADPDQESNEIKFENEHNQQYF